MAGTAVQYEEFPMTVPIGVATSASVELRGKTPIRLHQPAGAVFEATTAVILFDVWDDTAGAFLQVTNQDGTPFSITVAAGNLARAYTIPPTADLSSKKIQIRLATVAFANVNQATSAHVFRLATATNYSS